MLTDGGGAIDSVDMVELFLIDAETVVTNNEDVCASSWTRTSPSNIASSCSDLINSWIVSSGVTILNQTVIQPNQTAPVVPINQTIPTLPKNQTTGPIPVNQTVTNTTQP